MELAIWWDKITKNIGELKKDFLLGKKKRRGREEEKQKYREIGRRGEGRRREEAVWRRKKKAGVLCSFPGKGTKNLKKEDCRTAISLCSTRYTIPLQFKKHKKKKIYIKYK